MWTEQAIWHCNKMHDEVFRTAIYMLFRLISDRSQLKYRHDGRETGGRKNLISEDYERSFFVSGLLNTVRKTVCNRTTL